MADNKKNQTIIIKKIQAGHAAAHGGAWKVAYADFVTAMMAFFLVMWLLGADEEVKQAISDYFNNPVSALRPDLSSRENIPLGDRTGAGDNMLKGAQGEVPSDLVERPSKPYVTDMQAGDTTGKILEDLLADDRRIQFENISFSVPEEAIFAPFSAQEWAKGGLELLEKLGKLVRKHNGSLKVVTQFDEKSGYEFQLSRAVSISREMTKRQWIGEERINAQSLHKAKRQPASQESESTSVEYKSRRIEFSLFRHTPTL